MGIREMSRSNFSRFQEPPKEPEKWWNVKVTITREYEGEFFGTKESAEQDAADSFKQHDQDFDEETIKSESEPVSGYDD